MKILWGSLQNVILSPVGSELGENKNTYNSFFICFIGKKNGKYFRASRRQSSIGNTLPPFLSSWGFLWCFFVYFWTYNFQSWIVCERLPLSPSSKYQLSFSAEGKFERLTARCRLLRGSRRTELSHFRASDIFLLHWSTCWKTSPRYS